MIKKLVKSCYVPQQYLFNSVLYDICFGYYSQAVIKTDAGRDLCTVEGENGNTPLHSSCEKGDLEIVKVGYVSRYVCGN